MVAIELDSHIKNNTYILIWVYLKIMSNINWRQQLKKNPTKLSLTISVTFGKWIILKYIVQLEPNGIK